VEIVFGFFVVVFNDVVSDQKTRLSDALRDVGEVSRLVPVYNAIGQFLD